MKCTHYKVRWTSFLCVRKFLELKIEYDKDTYYGNERDDQFSVRKFRENLQLRKHLRRDFSVLN